MAVTVAAIATRSLVTRFPLLQPLADRNFAVYWTGRAISLCGDQFHTVALAIIALDLTHSASGVGAVLAVEAIPRALLMLFGGVATDRFRARSVMLVSDMLQTMVVAALAVMAFRGHLRARGGDRAALSPRGILAAGALSITLSGVIGLASRQMRDAE